MIKTSHGVSHAKLYKQDQPATQAHAQAAQTRNWIATKKTNISQY